MITRLSHAGIADTTTQRYGRQACRAALLAPLLGWRGEWVMQVASSKAVKARFDEFVAGARKCPVNPGHPLCYADGRRALPL